MKSPSDVGEATVYLVRRTYNDVSDGASHFWPDYYISIDEARAECAKRATYPGDLFEVFEARCVGRAKVPTSDLEWSEA